MRARDPGNPDLMRALGKVLFAPVRKLVEGVAGLIAVVVAFGNWKKDGE